MKKIKFIFIFLFIFILFLIVSNKNKKNLSSNTYAIWVTRFDYSSIHDIHQIVKNCHEMGFTDILFQVRGNGTVFFKSDYEPYAYELFSEDSNYENLGWDPLQSAIDFCNIYDLRIHAYINVLPGWKGTKDPPISNGNLWSKRKDLFMVDFYGDTMLPTTGWYTFLNPSHPEVISHLTNLCNELKNYDIDGLHLDYIRYPYDYHLSAKEIYPYASEQELRNRSNFSFDNISLNKLISKYGESWTEKDMINYKNNTISDLIYSITSSYNDTDIILSASILADPVESRMLAGQDSVSWVKKSLLDWIIQMNYNSSKFNENLKKITNELGIRSTKDHLLIGMYCDKDNSSIKNEFNKIKKSNCRGYAFFSYGLLFNEHKINSKGKEVKKLILKNITQ